MGDEAETDILNSLGNWAEKDNFGGDFAGGSDHGDWIDDRDGIEKSLDENIPDGSNIAIFDVDGTKQKGEAEREEINFKDSRDGEEPSWAWGDTVDESKDNNDDEVDKHIDDGG